jgi:hypothetical protein
VKRGGRVALALVVGLVLGLCAFVAVFLAKGGLPQASDVATVLGVPIGSMSLIAAVIAVLPRTAGRSQDPADKLDQIADDLAHRIGTQWGGEAQHRVLHRMRVYWTSAKDCFESWDDIERTAREALPISRGQRGDSSGWVASADELAGSDDGRSQATAEPVDHDSSTGILAAFDKVPTGRLVILGEPGSGKTMLLIHLLQGLLERRANGDAVPALVSLDSWNPKHDDLHTWALSRLAIDYPDLNTPVSAKDDTIRGRALLDDGKLLLILDGLDEIREEFRDEAISAINGSLRRWEGLVITCRRKEFEKATRPEPGSGAPVSLLGAAGIALKPLDTHEVSSYLRRGAQSDHAKSQWDPVLAILGTEHPLARSLNTPLTVTLANDIYNPGPEGWKRSPVRRVPADLLDIPDELSIRYHLFDVFLDTVYPDEGSDKAQGNRSREWLTFLARNPGLAWWELQKAASRATELTIGLICGIAAGIAAGTGSRSGVGIGVGLGVGVLVGLACGLPFRPPSKSMASEGSKSEDPKPARGIVGGFLGAAVGGLAAGVAGHYGIGHAASIISGLPVALGVGLAVGACTPFAGGLAGGLIGGFTGGLLEGVWTGWPAGIVNGLGIGLVVSLIVRFVGRDTPADRRQWSRKYGLAGGLAVGGAVGLIAGLMESAPVGLVLGVLVGGVAAWPVGLVGVRTKTEAIPAPAATLARDVRSFWRTALAAGIAAGAFGFGGGGLASVYEVKAKLTFHTLMVDGLGIGLASLVVVGIAFGIYHSASPCFLVSRIWLSLRGRLPLSYMSFLDEARTKDVLRRNGAAYEFRHAELRDYLAGTDMPTRIRNRPLWPKLRLNLGAYQEALLPRSGVRNSALGMRIIQERSALTLRRFYRV